MTVQREACQGVAGLGKLAIGLAAPGRGGPSENPGEIPGQRGDAK